MARLLLVFAILTCEGRGLKYIHSLRLNTKLLLLFSIISFGMLATAVIGYLNMNSMKRNIDGLYFGSFIPVIELNHILLTYHQGIESTIIKVKNGKISPENAAFALRRELDSINAAWESYSTHFKHEAELRYIDYTNTALFNTNNYVERVIEACRRSSDLSRLSEGTLEKALDTVQKTVNQLIDYEIQSAQFERKTFISTYDDTVMQIVSLFITIFMAVLLISYLIFRSIHQQQELLETASRKLRYANKKLQNASYTDSLTGLYNRRFFNMVYAREIKRAKREKRAVCFMMIDIDHFKQYNDTYGHLEGDATLKKVATCLRQNLLRPGDFVFRLGGEEFGVVITDGDAENSKVIAEKLCRSVRKLHIEHKNNSASKYVTISVGAVTLTPSVYLDEEAIISEADRNLYEAKETGRNGYVCTTGASDENPATQAVHVA